MPALRKPCRFPHRLPLSHQYLYLFTKSQLPGQPAIKAQCKKLSCITIRSSTHRRSPAKGIPGRLCTSHQHLLHKIALLASA